MRWLGDDSERAKPVQQTIYPSSFTRCIHPTSVRLQDEDGEADDVLGGVALSGVPLEVRWQLKRTVLALNWLRRRPVRIVANWDLQLPKSCSAHSTYRSIPEPCAVLEVESEPTLPNLLSHHFFYSFTCVHSRLATELRT